MPWVTAVVAVAFTMTTGVAKCNGRAGLAATWSKWGFVWSVKAQITIGEEFFDENFEGSVVEECTHPQQSGRLHPSPWHASRFADGGPD